MILRCLGDPVLDPRCAWHEGAELLWCTEHETHGDRCILRGALAGEIHRPPCRTVPSDWPGPRVRIVASGVWARPGGPPEFVVDHRAHLSVAGQYTQLVWMGLS